MASDNHGAVHPSFERLNGHTQAGLIPDGTVPHNSGEAGRLPYFETLLDIGPDFTPRAAIADKGSSSKANRAAARAGGISPVIPHKANEKNQPAFFARTLYKA